MTTLKSIISIVTITVLFLCTACEKDAMHDLDQQVKSPAEKGLMPGSRMAETSNYVLDHVVTEDLSGAAVPNPNARGAKACLIKCSTGIIYASNKGGSNNIDATNMPCDPMSDNFDGEDRFYYFKAGNSEEISGEFIYTITLSDLDDDLDLFVYALDASGRIKDCKGASITIGPTAAESIELVAPGQGYYLIVVDAYDKTVVSDFALELICDTIGSETPCWDLNGNGQKDQDEDKNQDNVVNEDDCSTRQLTKINYQDDGVAPGEWTGTFTLSDTSEYTMEEVYSHGALVEVNNYDILGRNQWQMFLRDRQRNIDVVVDLSTGQIIASDHNGAFAAYSIKSREFMPIRFTPDASVLTSVVFSNSTENTLTGTIEFQHFNNIWREYSKDDILVAEFVEDRRDEWSVYLRDHSRGVDLQLDIHHNKIVYTHNGVTQDLYQIIASN